MFQQSNQGELSPSFPMNGMDKSPMQNQTPMNGHEMYSQGNGKSPNLQIPTNDHENKSPILVNPLGENSSSKDSLNQEDSKEKKMEKVAKLLENAKSKLAQKNQKEQVPENKPKDLDSLITNLSSTLFTKRESNRRSYSRHSSDSFSDNSPRKRNSNIPSPIRNSDSSSDDGSSSSSSTRRSRSTSYFSRKISYSRSRSPVHRNHRFVDKRSRSNSSERRYSQSSPPPPPPPPPYSPLRESSYQENKPDWNEKIPKFNKSKKKNSRYSRDPTRFLFLRQLDLSNLDKQKIFLGKTIYKLKKLDFRPFGKIENIILLFNSKCAFIDFFDVDSACSAKSLF
jgi:hypothetical protein